MKPGILMALALVCSLSACGTYSTSSTTAAAGVSDAAPKPKKPEQVLLTENDIVDRKYKSLGDISVTVRKVTIFDSDPTREKVALALKERAADMGADAVVLVRYGTVGIGLMSWGEMDGNGRAVVFQ